MLAPPLQNKTQKHLYNLDGIQHHSTPSTSASIADGMVDIHLLINPNMTPNAPPTVIRCSQPSSPDFSGCHASHGEPASRGGGDFSAEMRDLRHASCRGMPRHRRADIAGGDFESSDISCEEWRRCDANISIIMGQSHKFNSLTQTEMSVLDFARYRLFKALTSSSAPIIDSQTTVIANVWLLSGATPPTTAPSPDTISAHSFPSWRMQHSFLQPSLPLLIIPAARYCVIGFALATEPMSDMLLQLPVFKIPGLLSLYGCLMVLEVWVFQINYLTTTVQRRRRRRTTCRSWLNLCRTTNVMQFIGCGSDWSLTLLLESVVPSSCLTHAPRCECKAGAGLLGRDVGFSACLFPRYAETSGAGRDFKDSEGNREEWQRCWRCESRRCDANASMWVCTPNL
ncbi:hypothetical protein C8J56DRAFT_890677 [Mycena floridula]|nr:hypothetical protein C8J56DRAFT_890677 [Mycena floridula]